jgi:hypothetical protein
MSKVFVIDSEKRPLNPIHPAQARQLFRNKKAAVFRRFPFTIILKESRPETPVSPLRLKIDPGAKTSGIALVDDTTGEVVFAAELKHRGFAIRDALTSRRQLRQVEALTFQPRTDWFRESVTNIVLLFTKRTVILMWHRPRPSFLKSDKSRGNRRAER